MATSSESAPVTDVDPSTPQAVDKTLIFLHIPKAAGTTMASILTQQYGKSVSHHTKRQPHQQIQAMPEAQRRQLRLIHGHMPFGIHQYLSQPSTYFTMLRHPVDRVISHYYFILNSPEHSGYPVARAARNITQYVICGLQEQTNNVQTRHLSGVGGTVDFGECTARHLQQAKRNLETEFILAGTSEQFDATLLLLGQKLGWTPSPYPKLNVNPSRRKRDELPRQAIAMIERYNALDLELYRYATERLQQQIAAQGPGFQAALKAFQQANLEYGEVVQKGGRNTPSRTDRL
ncbi:MAG: sulfotransferase family 2 domain-containing protein, partial [Elainellaceae cyanobacterium]